MREWAPHVTVAAVVEREGRFLLVEEAIGRKRVLNQPAGHVEDGESLVDAVLRETLEETAWEFQPESVVGVYRWRNPDNAETFLRVCFAGRALRERTERALDPDILGTVWLTAQEVVAEAHRHRSPLVQRAVTDFQHGRSYPLQVIQDVSSS